MKIGLVLLAVVVVLALIPLGGFIYYDFFANPRVERELIENPDGDRAKKVMLLTLPSGRRIPVNYWRDGDKVYAGADGRWWKELVGEGHVVTVLVRGETLEGVARAVLDDPEYTKRVFASLRPNAIEGFGNLIEIRVGGEEIGPPGPERHVPALR
jgi:hypothetical protein